MARKLVIHISILLNIIFLSACNWKTGDLVQATSVLPAVTPSETAQKLTELTPTSLITTVPAPAQTPTIGFTAPGEENNWWNEAVFYEIFVRSFYDSNGDGIGDFNGIIEKLDYLNDGNPDTNTDLGINAIWLMPINPSPSYHGYDVTDYYAVKPDYGTMDDFKHLLEECHARGIHVIMDLVLNHTSSQHPWFIEALDFPQSERHDWYIWSDTNPGYVGPWDEKVWYSSKAGYYYAIFSPGMPDLNFNNNEVTREMYNVARFWLEDVGVDGFRLDAARYLIEDGKIQANTKITHAWWKNFRAVYKEINPQALTVGEVWTSNMEVVNYVQGDEFDMAFNFDLALQTIRSISSWNASSLSSALQRSYERFPHGTYATFLTNHDQDRVMSEFLGDQDKVKLAASVLLTAPGIPFIYYGEEIGMLGTKPDPQIRSPMQWSSESYAGFSTLLPWEAVNSNFEQYNVATESADPGSILSLYRRLIGLRSEHTALKTGDYFDVSSDNRSLIAFLRTYKEEAILVIINLSKKIISGYELSLEKGPLAGRYDLSALYGEVSHQDFSANSIGGFDSLLPSADIPPLGLLIIQLNRK